MITKLESKEEYAHEDIMGGVHWEETVALRKYVKELERENKKLKSQIKKGIKHENK